MNFSYDIKERNMVVKLKEELDHHNAEEIRKKIDKLVEMNNIKVLIFDFKETKFMDSSGIGVIMGRYKNIKNIGGDVGLINVSSNIDRVFKLSGMYKIVRKYSTIKEAVELLG